MTKRVRVPKHIGGVKLPKALRRRLKDLAASQGGDLLILEAFAAAEAVLLSCKVKKVRKSGKDTVGKRGRVRSPEVKSLVRVAPPGAADTTVLEERATAPVEARVASQISGSLETGLTPPDVDLQPS